jgi:hypothetical protein
MTHVRGRFLWYDLMTTDPPAAQAFYTKLLGWGLETWTGGSAPYVMWTRGGAPIGGSMALPEESRQAGTVPHWLAYIGTPDVDATARQAERSGGRVMVQPQDIPQVGRFAVLADPHGALFAVYAPAQEPAPPAPAQIGDCSWHELAAGDLAQALDFYAALFGWEKRGEAHDMGPAGLYQEYGCPGIAYPLGGVFNKPSELPAHFMLYFRVPDVPRAAEAVKSLGGQVLNGPTEVPGGDMIVNCLDPQGAAFSLHHHQEG